MTIPGHTLHSSDRDGEPVEVSTRERPRARRPVSPTEQNRRREQMREQGAIVAQRYRELRAKGAAQGE